MLEKKGRLFFPGGLLIAINGVARPVDDSNARLAIRFDGVGREAGYSILELDLDHRPENCLLPRASLKAGVGVILSMR